MTAEVTLQGNARFLAVPGSGHAVVVDGPPSEGGEDAGVRPMELMLLGLGSCMAFDVTMILRRMRQPLKGYSVRLVGERADQPPAVYTAVTLEHTIVGKGVSPEAVQRALALAEEKYCSASAMFTKTAKLTNTFKVVDE